MSMSRSWYPFDPRPVMESDQLILALARAVSMAIPPQVMVDSESRTVSSTAESSVNSRVGAVK